MLNVQPGLTVVRTLLSHYRYHPWQSLFLLTGLVAGVALWAAVQLINAEAKASYESANRVAGSSIAWRVVSSRQLGVPVSVYVDLRRAGFHSLFPVIEEQVALEAGGSLRIFASDLLALPQIARADLGVGSRWLRLIQPPYSMLLSTAAADRLATESGARLRLRNGRLLPPLSIDTASPAGEAAFMDIAAARSLFPQYERTDTVGYLASSSLDQAQLAALSAALPEGLRLQRDTTAPDLRALSASLHQHLDALGFLAFVVGTFIVFSAQRFALVYRQKTFTVLTDLGVSFRWLMLGVLAETLVWSLVGTCLGLLSAYVLAQALLPEFAATLNSLYGAPLSTQLLLRIETVTVAWLLSLSGLLLAVAVPVLLKMSAGRHKPSHSRTGIYWGFPAFGLLMCITGGAMLFSGIDSSNEGFLAIGLGLLGAALLLPALLHQSFAMKSQRQVEHGKKKNQRLLKRWRAAEGVAQLPSLQPAMMALLLALSAAGGIELMISSFRSALENWLENRLSADLFITLDQTPAMNAVLQEVISSGRESGWLASVHHRITSETHWQGRPTQVRGLDPAAPDTSTLMLAKGTLDNWRSYSGEPSQQILPVLINEQASYLRQLNVGDQIAVDNGERLVPMRIEGVFYDYGNSQFALFLPAAAMRNSWPQVTVAGASLWLNPDRADSLEQATAAIVQAGIPTAQWFRQDDVRTLSLKIFDRTFLITAALNVLTLLIAGTALLAALLGLMSQRLPQFALWRALGLSHLEIARLIMTPVATMTGLTWLVSIPLGMGLAWALVNRLNLVSFGWSMPLNIEITPFLHLGILSMSLVVVSLAFVHARLSRQIASAVNELGADA
ncbi:FtsX-like permease family protein [Allohahella sp. A8]|uniref:FtsX-like permease family protein n=1 Tax=Allohahella sp. A8 TaxID=3141461 RepID=UPI003A7FECEC